MTRTRKQRRLETRLVEGCLALGAAAGLLLGHAPKRPRTACHGAADAVGKCLGHSVGRAVEPYLQHAAVGAAVGLAVGFLIVLGLRSQRSGQSGSPFGRRAIPERVRHEVWRRDGARCVDCGERGRLEFDHIIPVSRGGASTARNLELRCEPCNRRKGARI